MASLKPPPKQQTPKIDEAYSSDERLRRFKFRIASRPAGGEPLWQLNGRGPLYTTRQAEAKIRLILSSVEKK